MKSYYELHILIGKNDDLMDNSVVYRYETIGQRNLGYWEFIRQLDYTKSVYVAVLDWRKDNHTIWTKGTTQPIIFETMERGLMPINFCDAEVISLYEFDSYESALNYTFNLMQVSTPNFFGDDTKNDNHEDEFDYERMVANEIYRIDGGDDSPMARKELIATINEILNINYGERLLNEIENRVVRKKDY